MTKGTMAKKARKYTVLDLFCGCGGLSKGFEMAGYDILLGVDFNKPALDTYKYNHKNSEALYADLSKDETLDAISNVIKGKTLDVIIGGPPCQGFSLTGRRQFDDERNKLYLSMIAAVKRFSPKAFVIENVPGMATLYKGEIKDEIVNRFTHLGYKVSYKILCSADYGVPQIRKRLVFVGIKNEDTAFEFPAPTYTPDNYITCEDAISDLPSLEHNLGAETSEYESAPTTDYQKQMRGTCNTLYNPCL